MATDPQHQEPARLPSRHSQFQIAFGDGDEWYLEGDRPRRYVAARARTLVSAMTRVADQPRRCPFCHIQMPACGLPAVDPELYMEGDSDLIGFGLEVCPRCAHWRFWSANYVCMDPPQHVAAASVAARFEPDLPEGCAGELARALRQRPHRWHHLTPVGLERFVTEVFRSNYGPCEVRHVGGTADGGVDVIFVTAGGVQVPIQVKRRVSSAKHEPVSTIRDFLGAMVIKGARIGVVVSTATAFTKPSWQAITESRRKGYVVELIDRGALDQMLGPLVPHRPWRELFARPELEVAVRAIQPLVEEAIQPGQLAFFF